MSKVRWFVSITFCVILETELHLLDGHSNQKVSFSFGQKKIILFRHTYIPTCILCKVPLPANHTGMNRQTYNSVILLQASLGFIFHENRKNLVAPWKRWHITKLYYNKKYFTWSTLILKIAIISFDWLKIPYSYSY